MSLFVVCAGTVIDDDPSCAGIDNEDPLVLDDSGQEQPAERPAPPKSGAAAAAAVAAAEADVAARALARRTWKDPIPVAREQAGTKAAKPLQASAPNGHGNGRTANSSRSAGPKQAGEDELSDAMAGETGVVVEAGGAGRGLVKGDGVGPEAAKENGAMRRKRTRSGMFVDCEEI